MPRQWTSAAAGRRLVLGTRVDVFLHWLTGREMPNVAEVDHSTSTRALAFLASGLNIRSEGTCYCEKQFIEPSRSSQRMTGAIRPHAGITI